MYRLMLLETVCVWLDLFVFLVDALQAPQVRNSWRTWCAKGMHAN